MKSPIRSVSIAFIALGCSAGATDDVQPLAERGQALMPPALPVTLSTDKTSYARSDLIHISYSGMAGNPSDWIDIAPAGSATTVFQQWVYASGATTGSLALNAPPGTWVIRAFFNNSYTLEGESAPFVVNNAPPLSPTISTDRGVYAPGDAVHISFGGMPGYLSDWIAVAAADAPPTSYVQWDYTNHDATQFVTAGVIDLGAPPNTALAEGTYVARAFFNNSFVVEATSAPFVVVHPYDPMTPCPGGQTLETGPGGRACVCPSGATDLNSNANCGQCGNACAGSKVCVGGSTCACPSGQTDCSGRCVDLQTDGQHCGSCEDAACSGQQQCKNGACGCPAGRLPCGDVCCGAGLQCKEGQCQAQCAECAALENDFDRCLCENQCRRPILCPNP